jgi:hypothetical protein
VAEMHLPAGHQAGEDAEGVRAFHATEDDVEVTMSENDASTMEDSGVGEFRDVDAAKPELIAYARVVSRLLRRPRVNASAVVHSPTLPPSSIN